MRWLELNGLMRRAYERHYASVARTTFTLVGEVLGLGIDVPDVIMRAVLATGGRRAGLLDLEGSGRQAIYSALAEGAAQGESIPQLTRRIRAKTPAGPWRDSQTRARAISRTETAFARNVSTLERAKGIDQINHFMVFDGRLPTSDEECQARDGLVVETQEAEALINLEHPNGTLSVVSIPSILFEELTHGAAA
jgi:hypothetical protein